MTPQILIVDDEPFMLRLIETSLKKGGFELTACRSGEQALELIGQRIPALVILDLMMPGMDGLATLRKMKEMSGCQQVPVIMLTAKGHKLTQESAEAGGANVFLTKPFSPTQLLSEVRRLLATQHPA